MSYPVNKLSLLVYSRWQSRAGPHWGGWSASHPCKQPARASLYAWMYPGWTRELQSLQHTEPFRRWMRASLTRGSHPFPSTLPCSPCTRYGGEVLPMQTTAKEGKRVEWLGETRARGLVDWSSGAMAPWAARTAMLPIVNNSLGGCRRQILECL